MSERRSVRTLPDGGQYERGEEQEEERSISDIAHEYLRATNEQEAKEEELLAEWAEEYYRPGYLSDSEWNTLKTLLRADEFGKDDVLVVIQVAAYRKASTELGREDEFDDEWPAKGGGQ